MFLVLLDPMDYSTPSSSVHGFLQARILEWVTIPSSRGSSRPRDQTRFSYVSCTGRWVVYRLSYPRMATMASPTRWTLSLSKLQELVMDREAWRVAAHGVTKSPTRLSDWTELMILNKKEQQIIATPLLPRTLQFKKGKKDKCTNFWNKDFKEETRLYLHHLKVSPLTYQL